MSHVGPGAAPTVLGISSSPRLKNSSAIFESLSDIMLQGILETIREVSDFGTETIHLSKLNIHPCRGCFSDMETRCNVAPDSANIGKRIADRAQSVRRFTATGGFRCEGRRIGSSPSRSQNLGLTVECLAVLAGLVPHSEKIVLRIHKEAGLLFHDAFGLE